MTPLLEPNCDQLAPTPAPTLPGLFGIGQASGIQPDHEDLHQPGHEDLHQPDHEDLHPVESEGGYAG